MKDFMKTVWLIYRTLEGDHRAKLSLAFKISHRQRKLVDNIKKDVVDFKFIKKDGTIRTAKGTKNLNLVPKEKLPVGTKKTNIPNLITYFDIDKNSWRSFYLNKLV